MIIAGYIGIGKSTLCKKYKKYIDLSNLISSDENCVQQFCENVITLHEQGYTVFTTTNKLVRNYFKKHNVNYTVICPDPALEIDWFKKLKARYFNDTTDKNYQAVENVKNNFQKDIKDLLCEVHVEVIANVDYELQSIITRIEDAN